MKNILLGSSRFLVLAPHTDDGEIGAGGTLARIVREGGHITYIAFSSPGESLPEGFTKEDLIEEWKRATDTLGIQERLLFNYPVRRFPEFRQKILEDMVKFGKSNQFDVVFVPSVNDVHQDHGVIYNEALRAFRDKNILAYEMPKNNINFTVDFFIEITREDLEKKLESISFYKSQTHRLLSASQFFTAQAQFRGGQAGMEYAEVFELIRWRIPK